MIKQAKNSGWSNLRKHQTKFHEDVKVLSETINQCKTFQSHITIVSSSVRVLYSLNINALLQQLGCKYIQFD